MVCISIPRGMDGAFCFLILRISRRKWTLAGLKPEFERRRSSVDPAEDHVDWLMSPDTDLDYPIIADTDLAVAKLYGASGGG